MNTRRKNTCGSFLLVLPTRSVFSWVRNTYMIASQRRAEMEAPLGKTALQDGRAPTTPLVHEAHKTSVVNRTASFE